MIEPKESVVGRIPKRVFSEHISNIECGYGEIELFYEDEIDQMQKGFRYDAITGELFEDWIGDEFVVIGCDTTSGAGPDALVINLNEEKLPVYSLSEINWNSPTKISNSFEDFISILKILSSVDLLDESLPIETRKELLKKIEPLCCKENMWKWEHIILRSNDDF